MLVACLIAAVLGATCWGTVVTSLASDRAGASGYIVGTKVNRVEKGAAVEDEVMLSAAVG